MSKAELVAALERQSPEEVVPVVATRYETFKRLAEARLPEAETVYRAASGSRR